ncbi:MAG: class I adenylate-forming enzyme family protein [Pseudomonadota bacterium]
MAGHFIAQGAGRHPDRAALIADGVALSYAALAATLERLRMHLAGLDLAEGSPALILMRSRAECWIAVMALRALGHPTVALRDGSQAMVLPLDGPFLVLSAGEVAAGRMQEPQGFEGRRVVLPAQIGGGATMLREPEPEALRPKAPMILLSSGTTGTPKLIPIPLGQDDARAAARAAWMGCDGSTVFNNLDIGVWTSPGFNYPPAVWHAGGTVVLDGSAERYRRFADFGVTMAFCSGEDLERLLNAAGEGGGHGGRRIDQVLILHGGGLLPLPLLRAVTERLTRRFVHFYAMTEVNRPLLAVAYEGDAEAMHWLEPVAGMEVDVVDEAGQPCPPGIEGALRCKLGPADAVGYLNAPEATARHFRDGWCYPGDLGERRADGRIRVLGREGDVIVIGAQKQAAGPIEERLRTLLGARAVCLFTGLDDAGEGRLIVAVETDGAVPLTQQQAIGRMFPSFRRIAFSTRRRFPRTETGLGKIQRGVLRRDVEARLSAIAAEARQPGADDTH